MGQKRKTGTRWGAARALLGRLGIKRVAGHRYVLPAAVGIAAGILAGAFAVEVVGVSIIAGVAVGVVAAGYVFAAISERVCAPGPTDAGD
jgi:hypothetical protein